MAEYIVASAVGRDRPGLVNQLTHVITEAGGNVETQRSAHMASEFAVVLLFSVPSGNSTAVIDALQALGSDFSFIQARPAEPADRATRSETAMDLVASGADQPGILDAVTQVLLEGGINIESLDFDTESAPMTGQALFRMQARISLPVTTEIQVLRKALRELEDEFNFDVLLHP